MTVEEAVAACERVNAQGIDVSLDSLGESVSEEAEARAAAEIYHRLLDAIAARGLKANVSLKLTQMGTSCRPGRGTSYGPGRGTSYGLGRARAREDNDQNGGSDGWELAEEIVGGIVEHAARVGSFVRVDMEGSA
jgi:proline dehydrogenase